MSELRVKTCKEYWDLVERTDKRVDSWPEWKIGTRSLSPAEERCVDVLLADPMDDGVFADA